VSKNSLSRGGEFVITPIPKIRIHPRGKEIELTREVDFDSCYSLIFEHVNSVTPVCMDKRANLHFAAVVVTPAGVALGVHNTVTNLKASESAIVKDQYVSKESPCPRIKAWQYLPKVLFIRSESSVPGLKGDLSARAIEAKPKLCREILHKSASLAICEAIFCATYTQRSKDVLACRVLTIFR
jgi:hypothetical protein